ncbi:hypothetical protein OIU84_030243 [Salix udensis]|uniref:Uncharacterized protein n=1 Tax=Salix udensis TaxID=889485 RepID=A0AAD6KBK0_9ROSI|nr:hypothetical protein OIU84_030243 [Salix udensis]
MTIRAQSAAKSTMDSVDDLYNIENCEARSMSFSCFEQNLWLCISCMCVYTFISHGFPGCKVSGVRPWSCDQTGYRQQLPATFINQFCTKVLLRVFIGRVLDEGTNYQRSVEPSLLMLAMMPRMDGWIVSTKNSEQVFLILLKANHGPFWCGYPHPGPFDLSID